MHKPVLFGEATHGALVEESVDDLAVFAIVVDHGQKGLRADVVLEGFCDPIQ